MNPVPGGGFAERIGILDVLTPVIIFIAVIGIFTFGALVVRKLTAIDAKITPREAGTTASWQERRGTSQPDAQRIPNPAAANTLPDDAEPGYQQPAYGAPVQHRSFAQGPAPRQPGA